MTTTYTDKQRAGIAAAFRAAKPLLWDGAPDRPGQHDFICFALDATAYRYRHTARNIVRERLDGYLSMCTWLARQGVRKKQMTPTRVQAHRHAWLDMLIAEFEAPAK